MGGGGLRSFDIDCLDANFLGSSFFVSDINLRRRVFSDEDHGKPGLGGVLRQFRNRLPDLVANCFRQRFAVNDLGGQESELAVFVAVLVLVVDSVLVAFLDSVFEDAEDVFESLLDPPSFLVEEYKSLYQPPPLR